MGSVFGNNIKISLFGESHGEAIGCVIDGFPYGINIDNEFINKEMDRRRAKNSKLTTARNEADKVEILSGILESKSTGMPIAAIIKNENKRSIDYANLKTTPRPSHSDYTAMLRYEGFNDIRGGGHFSGRLTAPLVFAGALSKLALKEKFDINIAAHIKQIYNIKDKYPNNVFPSYEEFINNYNKELSVFDDEAMNKMISTIEEAKMNMDSVGGIITAAAFNIPAGFGDPFYSSIESRIAQSLFAVPAVKGVDFGLGFDFVNYKASECNDAYTIKNNDNIKTIETKTNNNGGILGGISNGMPIVVNIVIKPTPSISKEQLTLNIETKEEETLIIKGRHDPCIAVRAVPVIESALAVSLLDLCIDMKGRLL
ncbi:chorismate synthase [uncultured Brachyspira sp.]|uniref:chorismate synthase n=1 Tax=uncultured Brachyspira sp. TaxID=221953 RepID=UPI0025E04903|nr:chorismate synthase [uncultured Brachyspira sp.]